jgi:hypothetical protein
MRSRLILQSAVLAAFLAAPSANATYDTNMTGVVLEVATYADADSIYFRLQNQPSSHSGCNAGYFALSASTPATRLNRLLARLLAAQATGEVVNIGYDGSGDCVDGFIRAHRVG